MSNTEEKSPSGFKVVDRRTVASDEAQAAHADHDREPHDADRHAERDDREPSEIDFGTFVMSLASSVFMHLGELMYPGESDAEANQRINLPVAKQTIDILGMLREKTRGNLSDDEAKLVEHLLYDVRLKYVEARKRNPKG